MPNMADTLTDLERLALARGEARIYRGRAIPIIRGGEADGEGKGEGGEGGGEDGGGDKGEASGGADGSGEGAKTFNEEQVNAIVQDRLARERKKFEGFDDLKKKAREFDKLQEAQKSELEKAQERAAELEREVTSAKTAAQEAALRSAVVAAAAKKNAVDPDAVVALIDRAALEFNEDGTPKNVEETVDELLKAKTYLVAAGGRSGGADQGARSGGREVKLDELHQLSDKEFSEKLAKGELSHILAGE